MTAREYVNLNQGAFSFRVSARLFIIICRIHCVIIIIMHQLAYRQLPSTKKVHYIPCIQENHEFFFFRK